MTRDIETTTLPQTPLDYATVDTNNLDFNLYEVVGQLPARPRREFLRRFVAATALFVGIGMTTFTVADVMTGEDTSSQAQDVAAAEATIQTAQETAVEADLNLDRKAAEFGEACTALFYDYMPNVAIEYDDYGRPSVDVVGGQLRDVAEDSMVTDVITAPNAPCGEARTEVRSRFRDLVAVYSDKIVKQHDVT